MVDRWSAGARCTTKTPLSSFTQITWKGLNPFKRKSIGCTERSFKARYVWEQDGSGLWHPRCTHFLSQPITFTQFDRLWDNKARHGIVRTWETAHESMCCLCTLCKLKYTVPLPEVLTATSSFSSWGISATSHCLLTAYDSVAVGCSTNHILWNILEWDRYRLPEVECNRFIFSMFLWKSCTTQKYLNSHWTWDEHIHAKLGQHISGINIRLGQEQPSTQKNNMCSQPSYPCAVSFDKSKSSGPTPSTNPILGPYQQFGKSLQTENKTVVRL